MARSTQRPGTPPGAGANAKVRPAGTDSAEPGLIGWSPGHRGLGPRKLPSVRLAPREELASVARVAPLLRTARDLDDWAAGFGGLSTVGELSPAMAGQAASALDLLPREVTAAWLVLVAARDATMPMPDPSGLAAVLSSGSTEAVLEVWDTALTVVLSSEELDGIATALYTVGGPVGIDGLFEAYASAAGTGRPAGSAGGEPAGQASGSAAGRGVPDHGTRLSLALETLADLAVVELGTEEADGSLTVALSPLGTWGVHRRLRAQGWHVPVLGAAARYDAPGLLAALADCDAEDGETEITTWLAARDPATAAAELIDAAAVGSPGQRGAAFAVLDRIGLSASDVVRAALDHPLLRAHAAVWLIEHGEDAVLEPEDRTWLLVDLGAGLLEEADPQDVVAELLPSLPSKDQVEIVTGLWRVRHPGVTGLLTALSDHHPDPLVARAARKAAFKARSPAASTD